MTRRRNLTIAISIILGLLLIVYVLFNSRLIIGGPSIVINDLVDGASVDEAFIDITGVAKNTSFISLNGRPILIDKEGNFQEKLLLSPGISIIKLYAKDKFNREILKTLNLNYTGTETFEIPDEVPTVEDTKNENPNDAEEEDVVTEEEEDVPLEDQEVIEE